MIKLTLFTLLISLPTFATISKDMREKIDQQRIYDDPTWLNLMHYRSNFFGGVSSEADGETFFFSKDGKSNPQNELIANIEAIEKDKNLSSDEHPLCRFPARATFFESKGLINLSKFKVSCPRYNKFKNKLSAKSISIVFSSYFLDTPASAFGHTLMRINKNIRHTDQEDQNFELLDYAINYSAVVTTTNSLLYGVMGFAGGFRGEFASMPYFYKVREYNDFESRDLWSYDLNLSQKEINMIVAHIWEMGQTYFQYYYLTENCSYHMLGLLDVANPKWNLSKRNPSFVIPVDTIKTLGKTPGLVRRVSYRPSTMRKAKQSVQRLMQDEKQFFEKVIKEKTANPVQGLSKEKQAKILDTAIDYLDFTHSEDILLEKPEALKWKNELLIARSETEVQTTIETIPTPHKQRPDFGHDSRRFWLGVGKNKSLKTYETLSYRFALHDFYDPQDGQNPQATMEMGHMKFNYYNDSSKLKLDFIDIVNVISLSPIEKYFSNISWRFKLGSRAINDSGCSACQAPTFQVGGGTSIFTKYFKAFALLTSELDLHKELSHNGFRFGVGPEAEIIFRPMDKLNIGIFGDYKWRFPAHVEQTYSYGSKLRYIPFKNYALNLDYKRYKKNWINEASLIIYF
ncbi:DUF4105 domain-containing protein [Halobacteriovorax sp. HLS]|uniref:Lnb N-terminal periplasmic domain-containing protein n=1 Tax=Halobacteriovorax sp. HLS TaxID=2234000 RepID=UPI000FD84B73|nr:DUF4105 domain-containing protein [Halobacteriovorax sp. HLS]